MVLECPECGSTEIKKAKSKKGYKRCKNGHGWFWCSVCDEVNFVNNFNDHNPCKNGCVYSYD